MNPSVKSARWPYPRVLAHRGAGLLAPENTLAAMRVGWERGYRGVEFDVMLTADAVPVLMHDPEFGRTIRAPGSVPETSAEELTRMDAGAWFGRAFAGEPVPLLDDVLDFCDLHGIFMNIEIKPAPGHEQRTAEVVARHVARHFAGAPASQMRPLFSSFSTAALAAAAAVAPEIARGHLFSRIPAEWQETLAALDCSALHCDHRNLDEATARQITTAGFGLFCYTVNDPVRAQELFSWGVDAFCTDRIDLIAPDLTGAAR